MRFTDRLDRLEARRGPGLTCRQCGQWNALSQHEPPPRRADEDPALAAAEAAYCEARAAESAREGRRWNTR